MLARPLLATTVVLHPWSQIRLLAVLAVERGSREVTPRAEVAAVDDQAALTSEQLQAELRYWRIWDEVEGVSQRALDRVGAAGKLDADRLVSGSP